jgi:hypothetical protein
LPTAAAIVTTNDQTASGFFSLCMKRISAGTNGDPARQAISSTHGSVLNGLTECVADGGKQLQSELLRRLPKNSYSGEEGAMLVEAAEL